MPIYEYKCTDCGEKFEVVQQDIFNPIRPKCPKCKSEKARRVYSASPRISSSEPPRQTSGFG